MPSSHDTPEETTARVPFGVRFRAWWHGCDPDDLIRTREAPPPPEPPPSQESPAETVVPWTADRIGVVERLWGPGFTTPGGAEMMVELAKPFALSEAHTLLVLGAGLGGGARAITEALGCWVTGFEADPMLAAAAAQQSQIAGLARRAEIKTFDPATFVLKPKSFDCIFSKEEFFRIADKHRLLKLIQAALKVDGQVMFTDYVMASDAEPSPRVRKLLERESPPVELWPAQRYSDELGALKLDLRIAEDMTATYRKMILEGWQAFVRGVEEGGPATRETQRYIVLEAEQWARRIALLDTGEVKVYRYFAIKTPQGLL